MPALSAASVETLFRYLIESFRVAPLDPPSESEGEARYTKRVLLPIVNDVIDRARVSDMLVSGHYTSVNRPVRFLGREFHPDIAVVQRERRLLAFEVKLLGGGDLSGAMSKSIGQASVYRFAGYDAAGVILLDRRGTFSSEQLRRAARWADDAGTLALVVRSLRHRGFSIGHSYYVKA